MLRMKYQHEYFSEKGKVSFRCVPTLCTQRLLINMGVIFKASNESSQLLFDIESSGSVKELCELFVDENIVFILYPEDTPLFYAYTEGFKTEKEGAFVFSINPLQKSSDGVIDLGVGEFMDYSSSFFSADELTELRNRTTSSIPIVFKVSTNQLITLLKTQTAQEYVFILNFKSRDTYYKYYIADVFDNASLKIVDVENIIEFIPREEETVNGKNARVFFSTNLIKSLYQAKQHFQLVEESSSASTHVLMDYLPLPVPGRYFYDQVNGESVMVSEVFIN